MSVWELDRRLGSRLRNAADPATGRAARAAADALAPAFRTVVLALIVARPTRATGLRAGAAGTLAAGAARAMRDHIGRPRPGSRHDAGFPSRHAAAATAIALAARRADRRLGAALLAGAAVGLAGRVVVAEHEPADIAAGIGVGWLTDRALGRLLA